MLIKSRMGISADGFVSTPDDVPALAIAPGFEPGVSHGYPGFIEGCDAVVMSRTTAGLPLSPPDAPPVPLTLLRADRTFPDGSAELVYRPA
jgi:hypothetical protein